MSETEMMGYMRAFLEISEQKPAGKTYRVAKKDAGQHKAKP